MSSTKVPNSSRDIEIQENANNNLKKRFIKISKYWCKLMYIIVDFCIFSFVNLIHNKKIT